MGAWDYHPFDNDDAMDWLAELPEGGPEYLRETVATACQAVAEDYFDAYEGAIVVAASALVAAARQPALKPVLPAEAAAWLEGSGFTPDGTLAAQCRKALTRVMGENSELKDLWEETEYYDQWSTEMEEIRQGL